VPREEGSEFIRVDAGRKVMRVLARRRVQGERALEGFGGVDQKSKGVSPHNCGNAKRNRTFGGGVAR